MPDDGYVDLGFPDKGDPVLKRERYIETVTTGLGTRPDDAHPVVIVGEGTAEMAADNETLAMTVARAFFREYGRTVVGLPPIDATFATALITITTVDTAGYTIPAGVQVAIGDMTFTLPSDVTVPSGANSVAGCEFVAFEEGEIGSGLTGTPVRITARSEIASYSLDTPTSGGHDAESDTAYINRLARHQRTQGRPELAEDFAERMNENPEVFSTLVLDGYNADTATSGNDATVTLIARNTAGLPISTAAKDERLAAIRAEKVSGWNIFAIDGTYSTIGGSATVSVWPGYDSPTVLAAAAQAWATFLDPAGWGATPAGETADWNQEPTVLRTEVITALNNAHPGVRHVSNLLLGISKGVTALASSDVVTSAAHGFANADTIRFSGLVGGAPLDTSTVYFARDVTTDTFKVAATSGGAAINITTDITAGRVQHLADQDIALPGLAKLPLPGPVWIS